MWKKKAFNGLVSQVCGMVPGFSEGYRKFERRGCTQRVNW